MGYGISQIGREFFIPAGRKQEALEAVRAAGEMCGFTAEDIVKAGAGTLEELLDVLEWRAVVDEAGNITDLIFDGEKNYNDEKLMEALAPCVRTGSFIRMVGEDGWVWEWRFDNGGCTQINLNPDARWQEVPSWLGEERETDERKGGNDD